MRVCVKVEERIYSVSIQIKLRACVMSHVHSISSEICFLREMKSRASAFIIFIKCPRF